MSVNFSGYVFDDSGSAVSGATVQLLETGTTTEEDSTTTNADGYWAFSEAHQDKYDIKVTSGTSVRYRNWDDRISIKEIDVRNNTGNTTPAATFINLTNNASNQVAVFRSDRGTGNAVDGDEAYLSFNLRNSNNEEHEFARITAEAVDVTDGQEDGQLRFGIAKTNGNIVDVFTINSTTGGVTDMTLDVSGDLTLDADGGDIFFKDGGTTFGSATNTSGNLILKSGTTTAATFSGANVTFAGTVDATTDFTLGDTVITDGVITDTSGLSIVANTGVTGTLSASGLISANGGITFAAGDDIAFTGTTGTNDIVLTNGLADALSITDGSADVLVIDTSTSGNVAAWTAALTVGVDDTGHDVKFFGATAGSFLLWDESDDALELTDSSPIKIGDGGDMTIYHDGSNSYITNATGALKLATETNGIVVTIGHSTSEVTVADNLTVTGDLTVSGTTTTLNTATMTIEDPLVKYGQAYTGSAVDQGFIVTRGNGSASNTQNMAFIWDESADQFAAIKAATEDGATAGNVTVTDYVDLHVGTLVADDAITIGGTNVVTGSLITTLSTISAGVWNGTPIATAYVADNAITLDKLAGIASGKIIYGDASGNPAVLTKATDGDVLTLASGLPSWATPTTGDITSVVAGTGMTGGATTGAATVNVIGGDGITANANDVAITAAQTTITSIYATDIVIGEDAQTKIDFETADEIHFDANNNEIATITAAGLTMASGTGIIIDSLPDSDNHFNGIYTAFANATGSEIAQGAVVYHTGTANQVALARANADSTMPAIAIATAAVANGASGNFMLFGTVYDASLATLGIGGEVYVSEDTAGAVTATLPASSGDRVQVVGIGMHADKMFFNPNSTVIERA